MEVDEEDISLSALSPQVDPLPSLPPSHPSRQFGDYHLHKRIAMGGMAEILLAERAGPSGFKKQVVIKRVLERYGSDPDFAKMFIREAQVAAQLDHANIVSVFEFGKHEGAYFMAMEYVQGLPLSKVIRRLQPQGETGWRLASAVGVQMCRALHHAHMLKSESGNLLGLVHRDVSPGNILLDKSGAAKLTDFGIVKLNTSSEEATKIGVIKGKVGYMSPEQVRTQSLDRRSDIFSLGVTLYEAAIGRRLFKRTDDVQSILAIVGDDVPPPSQYDSEFPAELETIIGKAIRHSAAERWQDAASMGRALEEFRRTRGWGPTERDLEPLVQEALTIRNSSPSLEPVETTSATGGSKNWTDPTATATATQPTKNSFPLILTGSVLASVAFWAFMIFDK